MSVLSVASNALWTSAVSLSAICCADAVLLRTSPSAMPWYMRDPTAMTTVRPMSIVRLMTRTCRLRRQLRTQNATRRLIARRDAS